MAKSDLETFIQLVDDDVVMLQHSGSQIEIDNDLTPRQVDFNGHDGDDTDIEMDAEDLVEYQTPLVLLKKRKQAPAPIVESSEAEELDIKRRTVEKKGKGKNKGKGTAGQHEVSLLLHLDFDVD